MDLNNQPYPILEFDGSGEAAIIEPSKVIKPLAGVPERAVLCFFQDVITRLSQQHEMQEIYAFKSEIGTHPVFKLTVEGKEPIAVMHPGVGAPLAAGCMEEATALGCRKFIACGGAGVLRSEMTVGHIVVPTSAVRDEGTSYHYLPPSREVDANHLAVAAIEKALQNHNVEYIKGKTWTTDAFFRETPARIRQRKSEGCLTVEMEAATFFAVSQFRGTTFGQLLYGGDDIGGEKWDGRSWNSHSGREKLFWLAVEAVQNL